MSNERPSTKATTTGMKAGWVTGVGDINTSMEMAPAPAGIGSPMKSVESWFALEKRARRIAPATRKRNATAMPILGTSHRPH